MRIEVVSENMVKVTITALDLIQLDLTLDDIDPYSENIHSFLFHIMENVRRETNFNPFEGQVAVEAKTGCGGVVLLISRGKYKQAVHTDKNGRRFKVKQKNKPERELYKMIFVFENFEDMCRAISKVKPELFLEGAMYSIDNAHCILLRYKEEDAPQCRLINEFSTYRIRKFYKEEYIQEHGKLIAEKDGLVEMASEICKLYENL